jgi:hypothetical protein
MPVTLPVGRLMLDTSPAPTGLLRLAKQLELSGLQPLLQAPQEESYCSGNNRHLMFDQLSRQGRQSIVMTIRRARIVTPFLRGEISRVAYTQQRGMVQCFSCERSKRLRALPTYNWVTFRLMPFHSARLPQVKRHVVAVGRVAAQLGTQLYWYQSDVATPLALAAARPAQRPARELVRVEGPRCVGERWTAELMATLSRKGALTAQPSDQRLSLQT